MFGKHILISIVSPKLVSPELFGLDDTAGNTNLGPDPQGVLLGRANGALYIELITGNAEGPSTITDITQAVTVTLAIPIDSPLGCPAGTSQTGRGR